jgi:sodium/potassium/calcium exchanger 6
VAALVWTYLLSGVLIDLLEFLGMLSKLNKTFLGLTIIAVGNALPDGVTTIALAKQGYGNR